MIYIPSVIKDIIYNYKQELEYEDNKKNHEKKFINTLYLIKKFRNMTFERRNHGSMGNSNRRTITIGPMNKNNHTYCFCFSICLNCNNYIHSSRMYNNDIAKTCQCY
ncbi:uncharacterized protein METZ01_LOCUS153657 [marine metagenome]|uniref:Uncharacterized protein n=1 Tax=marine metagenome TaxID=408172 RepID=A0A382AIJ3_9ZZZZ